MTSLSLQDFRWPFVGHEAIIRRLEDQLIEQKLPHALLFIGPRGIGKSLLARYLSQRILQPDQPYRSQDLFQHADLHWIEPENSRINIDTIRDIKKNLQFAPFASTNRVVVLNDAHCLNQAAANAILKSLEEPPTGTFFILITHALGWLPRTIVSRTQKITFSPLKLDHIKEVFEGLQETLPDETVAEWLGSVAQVRELKAVEELLPGLNELRPGPQAIGFQGALKICEDVLEQNLLEPFLRGLLCMVHMHLTQPGNRQNSDFNFDLLTFADKILEMKNRLRLNINAKMHLTRLLLFFQEPIESRL